MARPVTDSMLLPVALLGLLLPGLCADPAAAEGLDELRFMVGSWRGETSGVLSEELWTSAAGGVMLGVHRDVGTEGKAFFEFLRIEERESGLVYVAQPRGGSPTEFAAVEMGEGRAVFENPEHDFPQRLVYRRNESGELVVRIEGSVGGEERAREWVWAPVR